MVTGPLLLGKPSLAAPAAIWGGIAWILCVRQPFREKPVFLLYYTYLVFLFCSGAFQRVA